MKKTIGALALTALVSIGYNDVLANGPKPPLNPRIVEEPQQPEISCNRRQRDRIKDIYCDGEDYFVRVWEIVEWDLCCEYPKNYRQRCWSENSEIVGIKKETMKVVSCSNYSQGK